MANVIHVRHDWSEGINWPQNSVATMCAKRSKGRWGFPTRDQKDLPWCMVCVRALYSDIQCNLPELIKLQTNDESGVRVHHTILWYENLLETVEPMVFRWKERQERLRRERAARKL